MEVRAIDHLNLEIPKDRIEEALGFYRDLLGFGTENLTEYRDGDRPLFAFRLGESCIIHVRPTDEFEKPTGNNLDHFSLVLEVTVDEIRATLEEAGHDIQRESTPLGATGRNPAVYVEDPFGYILELKQARGV